MIRCYAYAAHSAIATKGFVMRKRLTITIDAEVYEELYRIAGEHHISRFIEDIVRPHVITPDLDAAYAAMAQDTEREEEAFEWAEAMVGNLNAET